ncbi:MAG: hypothetical protein WC208_04015 [Gallionella sp.]|jgi:hypothetical protein
MLNSQKTKLFIALLAISAASYAPHAMSFGLGDLGGGSTASTSTAAAGDPDAFVKSAKSAESLMNDSVTNLANALLSKKDSAGLAAQQKAANETTDAKDKGAKQLEVNKSKEAAINEALNNANLKNDIKKMDSKHKTLLGASAYNFMLALLQDQTLAEQAGGLISSLSGNPMNLGKLGGVKDAASSVSNQISSASKIATKMPDIFSAVGVKAPESKDDKPKQIAQVSGD